MAVRKAPPIVSFRLGSEHRALLDKEAQHAGVSAGDYARRLTIGALEEGSTVAMKRELAAVEREISKLRLDFAVAVKVMLVASGQAPDKAERWVNENLRRS